MILLYIPKLITQRKAEECEKPAKVSHISKSVMI